MLLCQLVITMEGLQFYANNECCRKNIGKRNIEIDPSSML